MQQLLTLLPFLACPATRLPLALVSSEQLASFNMTLSDKLNVAGTKIRLPLEAALITADGKFLYPVYNAIPELLPGSGIKLG